MADRTRLTDVGTVYEEGSWLFTVRDPYGEPEEVILVPCEDGDDATGDGDRTEADGGDRTEVDGRNVDVDGRNADEAGPEANGTDVRAWVNRCTHEAQPFDRGFGAAMRDGQIICPKHGSMFDACSGYCDNGEAADTTLVDVDVAVEGGDVFLATDDYEFVHEGSIEDGDAGEDGANDSDAGDGNGDDAGDENGDDAEGGPGTVDGSVPSWASDDDDDDAPSSTSHIGL